MLPRLHVPGDLAPQRTLRLEAARAHYLLHVLRLRPGAALRVFNAEDGEWEAVLAAAGRQEAKVEIAAQLRPPAPEPGPVLHFAPIRRNRMDWLVEKAVELGAARLVPLLTERTVVKLENPDRLRAIVVEAAEQCGRLTVPELAAPRRLGDWLAEHPQGQTVLFADEAGGEPIATALAAWPDADLLIGPEGGFAPRERALLKASPGIRPVTLGPRILRAESAALAALAIHTAFQVSREQVAR